LSCIFVVVIVVWFVFLLVFFSTHLAVVNEFIFILCDYSFVALTNQLFNYSINEITLFINFRPIFLEIETQRVQSHQMIVPVIAPVL
jgi:hypothetical protein